MTLFAKRFLLCTGGRRTCYKTSHSFS